MCLFHNLCLVFLNFSLQLCYVLNEAITNCMQINKIFFFFWSWALWIFGHTMVDSIYQEKSIPSALQITTYSASYSWYLTGGTYSYNGIWILNALFLEKFICKKCWSHGLNGKTLVFILFIMENFKEI